MISRAALAAAICLSCAISSALVGCADRKHNKNAKAPVRTETAAQDLSAKNENGVSTTDFTVPLNSSPTGTYAVIPFHFNTEKYKAFTVMPPVIAGENCVDANHQPKMVQAGGGNKAFAAKGKATPKGLRLTYGIEQASSENSDESIALFVYVPKGCTAIRGTLMVKFGEGKKPDDTAKK